MNKYNKTIAMGICFCINLLPITAFGAYENNSNRSSQYTEGSQNNDKPPENKSSSPYESFSKLPNYEKEQRTYFYDPFYYQYYDGNPHSYQYYQYYGDYDGRGSRDNDMRSHEQPRREDRAQGREEGPQAREERSQRYNGNSQAHDDRSRRNDGGSKAHESGPHGNDERSKGHDGGSKGH